MAESDSSSEEDKETFEEKMKRITKLGKEGNLDALVKEAKLADCSPEMIDFAAKKSKEMGNVAFQKKEYNEALEHYAGALVGDCPDKHKVYSNRSACLFQLGKYTDALVEATKSIKANRAWSKGYYRAGRAALEMEYYDEALEMFQKGLEKEPENKDMISWTAKAREIRNQFHQSKLIKKHATDYSKFDELTKQQKTEEEEEEMANDPNAVIFGDRYYSQSKMEQRQLKAMLGYKEDPPPPFEPTFDPDQIYRHDSRKDKTNHPIWDATSREWRVNAKPAPSRVDYSDSQQTQAIALFLERQTDVAYVEELLHLLDEHATPVSAHVQAVRDIAQERLDGGSRADDSRWLFVGMGTGLSALTASRFFPTAELIVATVHRPLYIAELSVAILRANTERKEQVRLIHRPFQDLAIVDPDGEDINNLTGKVDIVSLDHELFDPGLIGKGVLAKINHVKKRLATVDHVMMPMGAIVSCAPCEFLCPAETGPDGFDWSAVDDCRWGAFYDVTNLDSNGIHEPWRSLGPVLEVFEFDFTEQEVKLSGQTDLRFTAGSDGVLNCITFWYSLSLTEKTRIDHTPEVLRSPDVPPVVGDYYRHAQHWLSAPVAVREGDEVCIRASYSRSRIRFEVTSPEITKIDRKVACPRWMYLRLWDECRTLAFKKAIDRAVEKLMERREEVPKLERKPVRLVHLGAGIGQVSMMAAAALREAGWREEDVETYGYSTVAFESMPKINKLASRILKDNQLQNDVFFSGEDVRKLPSQPQRAQLIICELFDPGLLGEGILPLLSAARIKTCDAFDHAVIPNRGKVWAAAFEVGDHLNKYQGFDMSVFNHYRGGNMIDIDTLVQSGCARQLTNVFEALSFDFEKNEYPSMHTVKLQPLSSGKISAIVFWYVIEMDVEGEVLLTNWPETIPPTFSMLERDMHRPNPNRQAVHYFQGHYCKDLVMDEPLELDVGYTQSWPQFVWPGTEMVQKESGEKIAKPPPMPRHQLAFEKFKHETSELEKKLQQGLMFDEEMLGDGFAAAERVALEPNGNPNYMIDPNLANYFHLMFFL